VTPDCRIRWRFADGNELVTEGYFPLNILAHAEMFELVLPQACGGQAECGTCRVRLVEGRVSRVLGDEADLRERHGALFVDDERLACRARPLGDLHIELRGRAPRDLRDLG